MNNCFLIYSDKSCMLDSALYPDVPVLFDTNCEVVNSATDWFRHLRTSNSSANTVKQYAFTILSFWKFLASLRGEARVHWTEVQDSTLKLWRNRSAQIKGGRERRTINKKLSVVLQFYVWAQQNGYVSGIIGELSMTETPPMIVISFRHSERGPSISSDLLQRDKGSELQPVPTSQEMDDAFANLANRKDPGIAERDVLILRWGSGAGLRRAEILSLTTDQLPSIGRILELERLGLPCNITITGKGDKKRTIPVEPELIVNTIDYIETWRREVEKKYALPIATRNIFISHTSSKALNLSYVSQILSASFADSERRITGHRGRARFATKLLAKYLDDEIELKGSLNLVSVELILFRVAEILGHSDINSLRYYLDQELKTRKQMQLRSELRAKHKGIPSREPIKS